VIRKVSIAPRAEKQLGKAPRHIVDKLLAWVLWIEREGIEEVRKIPGFHDEPLKGKRRGRRSIRLSRAYRAIYRVAESGGLEIVLVEEVTKHGY
jgi:toxin HigB-1